MNASKSEEMPLEELEKEIWAAEAHLEDLRHAYMKKTGHTPIRSLTDHSWRWTIFMALGFAFISSMVYLLGISKQGSGLDTGIPAFFFETDFAYFAILTFFAILMILMVQTRKINGFQALALFLGYWCAHWLIYDWSWWAIVIGMGLKDMSVFWTTAFGYDLLIVNPQMWFFLTEAIIGATLALYLFTVPKSHKELLPAIIWLFAAYMNAEILQLFGVAHEVIFVMGMAFLSLALGLAAFFTIKRLKISGLPHWFSEIRYRLRFSNWSYDPLGVPMIFVMIGMLCLMHLFLVLAPPVGLFFGIIPWLIVPLLFLLLNSANFEKIPKWAKGMVFGLMMALIIVLMILMNILS